MYKVYRKIILACLLLIVAGTVCGQRGTQTINDGWKFSLFEGDAFDADFDVSGWTDVSIPHTWNAKDAEDEIPGYFRGKGWYRKAVIVEELIAGQRVYLWFEGVNQETNVFVNGKLVGNHKGGYSAFTFDVTAKYQVLLLSPLAVTNYLFYNQLFNNNNVTDDSKKMHFNLYVEILLILTF